MKEGRYKMYRDEMIKVYCFQNKISKITWYHILEAIDKRHYFDTDWLFKMRNWDGTRIPYLSAECMEWIDSVYFRMEGNYLDAEIAFSILKIRNYLSDEQLNEYLNYHEMKVKDLEKYFNTHKANIYKAIKKLPKECITKENGILHITAEGVRYLEQYIFKKTYWKRLEELRLWKKEKKEHNEFI